MRCDVLCCFVLVLCCVCVVTRCVAVCWLCCVVSFVVGVGVAVFRFVVGACVVVVFVVLFCDGVFVDALIVVVCLI